MTTFETQSNSSKLRQPTVGELTKLWQLLPEYRDLTEVPVYVLQIVFTLICMQLILDFGVNLLLH